MAGSKNLAEDPYERLANAIILQAVTDYRAALKRVKRNPKDRERMDESLRIERFFPFRLVSAPDKRGWGISDPQASGRSQTMRDNQGR